MTKTQLEAWYISTLNKSGFPSHGFYRTQITATVPFRITDPKKITWFDDYAEHNEWLRKLDNNDKLVVKAIEGKLPKTTKDMLEAVKERQFADDKIQDQLKEIEKLKAELEEKNRISEELEIANKELANENASVLEKSADIENQVKGLKKQLKKLKKE